MNRLLIRGGTLVTPEGVRRADLLVVGEEIAEIAPEIRNVGARVFDAAGYHLLPGLIDAHVHLRDPGATHKEDFRTGTRAALAGGVTTVLDMPNNQRPTISRATMEEKREIARAKAVSDFGLFVGGTAENAGELAACGAVGVKLYLGATTGDLLLTEFDPLYRHFSAAHGLPIVVHAEDSQALEFFARQPYRTLHSEKRPPLAASIAVARSIALAEATGRQLHIAHLSTANELELVRQAKARGVRVTCEVAPQHLFLSTEDEERLGAFGVVNPPLRSPENVRALWAHAGDWDMVATDHAPHTLAEKSSDRPPSGMPGLETMLPLLMTAVIEKRLSLEDVARLTARDPARVFHLAHKGELAPGYDADVVMVKLDQDYVLDKPWETRCGWSPFEGISVHGKIEHVLLRGRQVVAGGRVIAEPGTGREVLIQL